MSAPLQWKLFAAFVLVFIAGLVAGGYLETVRARHWAPSASHRQTLTERVRNRLETKLALTPAQIEKTKPIVDKAIRQMEEIRTQTSRRVHEVFLAVDREMSPELTPEQQNRLNQMEEQRDQNRDRELRRERAAEPTP